VKRERFGTTEKENEKCAEEKGEAGCPKREGEASEGKRKR